MSEEQKVITLDDITIELATNHDKQALIDFFRQHLGYTNQEYLESRITAYISPGFGTVVAKHKGRIVGELQWEVQESPAHGLAQILEVNVLPDYQGRGIGSAMTDYGIQTIKEYFKSVNETAKGIWLFVAENNDIARHIYEKHGMRCMGHVGDIFHNSRNQLFYFVDLTMEQ